MRPGLLVLHGNRLESLAEVVFEWMARNPLAALDEETVLVQSNGMAEWFKMSLAGSQGVCAATRVELPARFVWRVYRAVLGRGAVPAVLPLDKHPLVWRLMAMLPQWLEQHAADPRWAPLIARLQVHEDESAEASRLSDHRRLMLCQRIADLMDQYQVYRPDWLADWASNRDQLRATPLAAGNDRDPATIPTEQLWQPALWRAVLASLSPQERQMQRPVLHQRCLQVLAAVRAQQDRLTGDEVSELPRRVVLFGSTQLPATTLELLAALAEHAQVILAVPNPCRYFWADLIDGRDHFRLNQRRHPLRSNLDLSTLPLQTVQAHGHPLLAAWGRQTRDFVRQLDAFDDVLRSRERFELPRIDLFDDGPGETLLQQIQARIRDGVPLNEHAELRPARADKSIVFHTAHSAQREVEVLHDQLLDLLAHPPGTRRLHPRDVVVMVPDMEDFAASIRAVFGQFARGHPRHIPWGIADVHERAYSPLLQAVEWLLRIPQHRLTVAECRNLLELPSCAKRFGIREDELPLALDWLSGAGVRWGLHAEQRAELGLQETGDSNSWSFGLQRMLLGFAAGDLADGFEGVEPYAEVAGMSAGLAGQLSLMARALDRWWRDAHQVQSPAAWALRLRSLLQTFFTALDDADRAALTALDDGLTAWLLACEAAQFEEPVGLAVAREAWLGFLQEPGQSQRFRAGGVTFCTLLPMRAIPFEVVCLLGMNDGDYPRAAAPSDLDLMALPGLSRPGDRSRRHDDRQLMLDALLSARRVLHISWAGRSQRDNSEQPPSVLVAQLRDYIDGAWGAGVCAQRTVAHPLQPFSRRYFEEVGDADNLLLTYATEWRRAHEPQSLEVESDQPDRHSAGESDSAAAVVLNLEQLTSFVRNPVRFYFRQRLKIVLRDSGLTDLEEDESFGASGLERRRWLESVLSEVTAVSKSNPPLDRALSRLMREGRLPLAGPGQLTLAELQETLRPMLDERERVLRALPRSAQPMTLEIRCIDHPAVQLSDTLTGLRADDDEEGLASIEFEPASLTDKRGGVRLDKLVTAWLKGLFCAAGGKPMQCITIGTDVVVSLAPADPQRAAEVLQGLLLLVHESLLQGRPLATAVNTGTAWLQEASKPGGDLQKAYRVADLVFSGDESGRAQWMEGQEACLHRAFPSFEHLAADPGFEPDTQRLYGSMLEMLSAQMQVDSLAGRPTVARAVDD